MLCITFTDSVGLSAYDTRGTLGSYATPAGPAADLYSRAGGTTGAAGGAATGGLMGATAGSLDPYGAYQQTASVIKYPTITPTASVSGMGAIQQPRDNSPNGKHCNMNLLGRFIFWHECSPL